MSLVLSLGHPEPWLARQQSVTNLNIACAHLFSTRLCRHQRHAAVLMIAVAAGSAVKPAVW
jgi:hypothetical protein